MVETSEGEGGEERKMFENALVKPNTVMVEIGVPFVVPLSS